MADVLQETFDVTVRGKNYKFRVPSIRFDIEIGYKSAQLRRQSDPEGRGELGSVDAAATRFAWSQSVIALYLLSSDESWPFSPGPDGKPVVDPDKFPSNKINTVYELGEAFRTAYERFRDDGYNDGLTPSP